MIFKRTATEKEIQELAPNVRSFAEYKEWWQVTVTEQGMKKNIHIYHNGKFGSERHGWQLLIPDTCLETYSKAILNSDLQDIPGHLRPELDKIKSILNSLDFLKLTQDKNDPSKSSPWVYSSYSKEGSYMVIDGVHRHIAAFIDNFVYRNNNFFPFEDAVCGILKSEPYSSDILRISVPKKETTMIHNVLVLPNYKILQPETGQSWMKPASTCLKVHKINMNIWYRIMAC